MGKRKFTADQLRALHTWRKRNIELEGKEVEFKASLHSSVRSVLEPKPLLLFEEMCTQAGWGDVGL
eukprot:1299097-Amphidinium_carterae.1